MNAIVNEFRILFFGEPKIQPKRSKVEVLTAWFWKVQRIRETAIKERDLNTKTRCEIIANKLSTRLNELYTSNYLSEWKTA